MRCLTRVKWRVKPSRVPRRCKHENFPDLLSIRREKFKDLGARRIASPSSPPRQTNNNRRLTNRTTHRRRGETPRYRSFLGKQFSLCTRIHVHEARTHSFRACYFCRAYDYRLEDDRRANWWFIATCRLQTHRGSFILDTHTRCNYRVTIHR